MGALYGKGGTVTKSISDNYLRAANSESDPAKKTALLTFARVAALAPDLKAIQTIAAAAEAKGVGGKREQQKQFVATGFNKAVNSTVSSVGKGIATVSKVALTPVTASVNATSKLVKNIPVLGGIVGAVNNLALLPINVTQQVLEGGRLDKVALANFKSALKDVATVGPWIQTVISFVPGIGTGISAAIGAGLALAEGKSLSDAMVAGLKGALPGGPAVQMAFSVAKAAIERKPFDQIAIAALPISDQQKKLLSQGMSAVKDIAYGKNVAQSIVDNAIKSLPPEYAKAIQIGMAVGHAKSLQEAVKIGATGAASAVGSKVIPNVVKNLSPGVSNAINTAQNLAKSGMSTVKALETVKKQLTPANALALAKKNLPPSASLLLANAMTEAQKGIPNPMRSPVFIRPGSLPIVSLARKVQTLSAVPSATKAVVDAIKHNPSLMGSSRQLLAQGMRTNAATVNDAMAIISKGRSLLPWRSMAPNTVNFIRRYAPNAPITALRHAHTNVGGLDSSGTVYIVEKGDGPWAIAQKLTGNGNRWKELLDYNKDKNPKIDKNVWVGEPINLPPSWQKPVISTSKPNAPALPAAPPPSIGPVSDPVNQAATTAASIVPSILQAKAILAAWGKTDGINQSGFPDYGLNPSDMSTSMGPRDTLMLQSFQVWDNKTLNDGLPTDGNLDAKTLTALQGWAMARANAVVPSASIPVSSPGLPAAPIEIIPTVIGGTDVVLPTVTVTPKPPAVSATPQVASASKPTTGGSGAAIAVGAVIGGLLFGVPGALVGAAGGAAIS